MHSIAFEVVVDVDVCQLNRDLQKCVVVVVVVNPIEIALKQIELPFSPPSVVDVIKLFRRKSRTSQKLRN